MSDKEDEKSNVISLKIKDTKSSDTIQFDLSVSSYACGWIYQLDGIEENDPIKQIAVENLKNVYSKITDQEIRIHSLLAVLWHTDRKSYAEWAAREAMILAEKLKLPQQITLYTAIEYNDIMDIELKGKLLSEVVDNLFHTDERHALLDHLENETEGFNLEFLAKTILGYATTFISEDPSYFMRFCVALLRTEELIEETEGEIKTLILYLIANEEEREKLISNTPKKNIIASLLYDDSYLDSVPSWDDIMGEPAKGKVIRLQDRKKD